MANKTNSIAQKRAALTKGRGGGQGKPRTPSGERRTWTPPAGHSTPANRGKPASG